MYLFNIFFFFCLVGFDKIVLRFIEIIKYSVCYGSQEFANEIYKEILYNQRNNSLMFINLKNLFFKKIHHYKTYKTYTIIIYLFILSYLFSFRG